MSLTDIIQKVVLSLSESAKHVYFVYNLMCSQELPFCNIACCLSFSASWRLHMLRNKCYNTSAQKFKLRLFVGTTADSVAIGDSISWNVGCHQEHQQARLGRYIDRGIFNIPYWLTVKHRFSSADYWPACALMRNLSLVGYPHVYVAFNCLSQWLRI